MTQTAEDESAVRELYSHLVRCWNSRDAKAFGGCFVEDGSIVGFDGSLVDGNEAIAAEMAAIFAHHQTPAYVQKIKSVRFLGDASAILRGFVGMPSPLDGTINPSLNSIQTLIAEKRGGEWRVVLFQNTPAQFHGRPDLVQAMTDELQQLLP